MNWNDYESIIASELRDRYEKTKGDLQKADFLAGIQAAKTELLNLNSGGRADYCLPFMGEAYAIYYHMQRADNILTALSRISRTHALPSDLKVLDVGSGTGSGATAICAFLSEEATPLRRTVTVYGVEKAEPMSKMAASLLRHLQRLVKTNSIGLIYYQVSSTQVAVSRLEDGIFDLILFSYTFDIYSPEDRHKVMQRVLELIRKLRHDGIVVLITPKPNPAKAVAVKADFISELIHFLKASGMESKAIPIRRGLISGQEKRPAILRSVCEFFNDECQRLGLPPTYVINDDFPWYGFYAECNVLTWK